MESMIDKVREAQAIKTSQQAEREGKALGEWWTVLWMIEQVEAAAKR